MSGVFQDSAGKRCVRENWDTPLLRFLHEEYGFRYRYLGLPGVDATDLYLWRDMIDEVVAFEVDSPGGDDRANIVKLRTTLRGLGIPFTAYYGPFELVVMRRRDWDGLEYRQERVITLYNLDFCDEIASKIDTRDQGEQLWRFQALRQVLMDEAACLGRTDGPNWFVFMLTVRDQMDARKLAKFLSEGLFDETKQFCDACTTIQPLPSRGFVLGNRTWALKAFLHDTMRGYMTSPHISATFFPFVKYSGRQVRTPEGRLLSPMLHWMIFCQFEDPQRSRPRFYPREFLKDVCTLRADPRAGIVPDQQAGETGRYQVVSAPDWFRRYSRWFSLP